jgi:hypothetical protein
MNKRVVAILILTFFALIAVWVYSVGPLANMRKKIRFNPSSLKPILEQIATTRNLLFNLYHNRDVGENFYTIKLPLDWHLQKGAEPGGYSLAFNQGNATIGLMDVPDNTTIELYVLSQEEPRFKRTILEYKRLDYKKITLDSTEAYQLTYSGKLHGEDYQIIRTYIPGQDRAAVLTMATKKREFTDLQVVYASIIESFHWERR